MKRSDSLLVSSLIVPVLVIVLGAPVSAETACDANLMCGSIAQLSPTHATVDTSILIDVAAEEVWAIPTDFEAMPSWSTGTLQGVTGDSLDGGSVVVTFIFGGDEDGRPASNEIRIG